MLAKIMKISEQANIIGNWLSEQVAGGEARVELLENQRKLWQKIFDFSTDSKPAVMICFDGETARGGFNQRNTLNKVDRQWIVVVLQGRGFARSGLNEKANGHNTPFYDDCEAVRDLLRRLVGISDEPIDYVSMRPLPGVAQPNAANTFLDGFVITFTTANNIPNITLVAPGQEP